MLIASDTAADAGNSSDPEMQNHNIVVTFVEFTLSSKKCWYVHACMHVCIGTCVCIHVYIIKIMCACNCRNTMDSRYMELAGTK